MGVENFLLSSTLNAVLAQRLVRRICKDCIETYDPPKEVLDRILKIIEDVGNNKILMQKDHEISKFVKSIDKNKIKLSRGKGCPKCGNTGYRGRLGIFELVPMSDEIGHEILENSPASKMEKTAIEQGMITLNQDGYLRVIEGVTTLEEVMRVSS